MGGWMRPGAQTSIFSAIGRKEELLPLVCGFCYALDELISGFEKTLKIAVQYEGFGDPTQRIEWRGKAEFVAHERLSVRCGLEVVVVDEALECALGHDVLKMRRPGVLRNERGVGECQAEVAGAPSDGLLRPDDAGGDTCYGLFAGLPCAGFMQVDA
jgi:hypothetical protein